MTNELPDQKDQKIKDLIQQVQVLKTQYAVLDKQVQKNSRLAKRKDVAHDKELIYLKKVLMGVVFSFGIWSVAGDRVQSVSPSGEDAPTLIDIVGWVLNGSVGIAAISRTEKHIEDEEGEGEDEENGKDGKEDKPIC